MNWLEDIWTMHRYDLENESLKMRMNKPEMMAFGESNWKDSWIAPEGSKEFLTIENNYEHGMKLEPWIFKRTDKI